MEYQVVGTSVLVRLTGELDLVVATEIKRVVYDLLDRRKIRNLYVNLERVSFLDSSFLGALFTLYRSIDKLGGRVGLIRPQPAVRPTLELSGIFLKMAEFGSEPEAMAAG